MSARQRVLLSSDSQEHFAQPGRLRSPPAPPRSAAAPLTTVGLTYGTRYDYHSVMHYGADRVTGLVLKSSGQQWEVQRHNKTEWGDDNENTYFTPLDIYTIKKLYGSV